MRKVGVPKDRRGCKKTEIQTRKREQERTAESKKHGRVE